MGTLLLIIRFRLAEKWAANNDVEIIHTALCMVLSKRNAKYGKTLFVHRDLLTDAMAALNLNFSGRVLIGWHYQVLEFFTAVQRIGHYEVVG